MELNMIDDDEAAGVCSQQSDRLHINNLPPEVLQHVLRYFSFGEVAKLRLVSKLFNKVCGDILNTEFYRLRTAVEVRYSYVKSQMPRRESSRRNHILSRESDIAETLHMKLALLNLTVGKHIERDHCCFFAGEVLDEVNRLLTYVKKTSYLNRPFKVTDELFDLSTMAVEYFKEHIEPTLPEIVYFADFIGNSPTNPFKPGACISTEISQVPIHQIASKSSLYGLNYLLQNTRRTVFRNQISIASIRSSIALLYQNIDIIESFVHHIKKEQNDFKEKGIPQNCLNELLFQLNQCSMMIDSFKSQLSNSQKVNQPSSVKHSKGSSLNSETIHSSRSLHELSNCEKSSNNSFSENHGDSNISIQDTSTSQNTSSEKLDSNDELHNINCEGVASAFSASNKRKKGDYIRGNIRKKRKP